MEASAWLVRGLVQDYHFIQKRITATSAFGRRKGPGERSKRYEAMNDAPEFSEQYCARERQADFIAAKALEIADTIREGKKARPGSTLLLGDGTPTLPFSHARHRSTPNSFTASDDW